MRARAILIFCAAALLAGCGGSSDQKVARELSHRFDCSHVRQTSLRATECVSGPRVRSLSGDQHVKHAVLPTVACKVRLEATFYAANDWLSLASALAKRVSPCAQYYISVPPVQGKDDTWTIPRSGEAKIIRKFGPNFHAMAETRVWAWADWVKKTKKSWYEAGVLARKRMVTAGYSFSLGDIWAINEFPLTLPLSKDQQRAMSDFARGLYQGGPAEPSRKGLVWRVVPFQDQTDLSQARDQLVSWLKESSFWHDMSSYARWWSSEVFAFPSASCAGTLAARTANVTHYLNSLVLLVEAGKDKAQAADRFLQSAYVPLENAAWRWTFGFGITTIPAEEMARFVSLQMYATAAFDKLHPKLQTPVRLGFAWAPNNPDHFPQAAFAQGNKVILGRLADALHDTFTPNGIDPAAACGRNGKACLCKYPGAQLNEGWLSFPRWTG